MASERSDGPRSDSVGDARHSLALWLRAGRAHRGMSLDDVARVTKIQPRILERLEAGKLEGLPAAVFVRGFVRSFARCVGLDEGEALRRYAACAIGSQDLTPTVRALVEVMADLAPTSATAARATPRKMEAVEVIDLAAGSLVEAPRAAIDAAVSEATESSSLGAAPSAPASTESVDALIDAEPVGGGAHAAGQPRKRRRRRKGRDARVMGTPPAASPIVVPVGEACARSPGSDNARSNDARSDDAVATAVDLVDVAGTAATMAAPSTLEPESDAAMTLEPSPPSDESVEPATPWSPKMPLLAATPSVPWRRPASRMAVPTLPAAPSLVIDDADPESAERVLEERAETLAPRRSFLPPILLDREDRSARQGGLTLAVILLLIAATLTLSYLMRRPSASGDGMTLRELPTLRG
jgi:hypothetical protein